MSRIYAAGVRATAIANITADVAGYISFDSNGIKVLDVEGLNAYLEAQFLSISTGAEYVSPATAASSLAAAQAVDTRSLVAPLDDAVSKPHWVTRADWPTTTDVLSGAALVTAITQTRAECDTLGQAIGQYYDNLENNLAQILSDYYEQQGIDSLVPPGIVRLIESRSYLFTWVNDRNEESAPSPASALQDFDQNDTAGITVPSPPSGRNIAYFRLYCATSGNSGAAFEYVPNDANDQGWPVGTLTITDSKKASERQEPCPTTTWVEPPAKLIGLVAGPNGAMAGFFDNTFCPCEPFVPYAWPVEYQKTTGWPIVGIGRFGQTYVVLTLGKPYYIAGADSGSLDSQPIDSNQACVSRLSIVNIEGGVVYASPDGLCLADASGVKVITEGHFSREDWQALVPSSIFAAEHEGSYLFHYDTGSVSGCYALDLRNGKLTTLTASGSAFYRDMLTDTLYMASGTTIVALFGGNTHRAATWKSKVMTFPAWANLGWLQVFSDFSAAVVVKLYRDGTLTDTLTLTSITPVRLTSVRAVEHEVRIETTARVTGVIVASSAQELKQL